MIRHNIQPEQQLCLILARRNLSPELADQADSLLRNGLDWDKVWGLALRHKIFPLISRHLERFDPKLVPTRIMKKSFILSVANDRRTDVLASELARIIRTFSNAGIRAVPFKGLVLANQIWGDHRLWSGDDLDILVRYRDMRRASDLLQEEGYRPTYGSDDLRRPKRFLLGRGKPITDMLAKEDRNITFYIDLHESIFPWSVRRKILDERVWEDVRPGDIFGEPGFVLPRFWNVILLSLHGAKHLFRLLKWAAELYELWNSPETDRSAILQRSEGLGLHKSVSLSLAVCEHVFGDGSEPISSDHVDIGLVRRLSRNVFRESRSSISYILLRLRLPASVTGKGNRLATMLFLPTIIEKDLIPLPRPFRFLHYGLRPIRLVLKHGIRQPMASRPKR